MIHSHCKFAILSVKVSSLDYSCVLSIATGTAAGRTLSWMHKFMNGKRLLLLILLSLTDEHSSFVVLETDSLAEELMLSEF